MEKTFLSLMLAVVLGVTLALAPLMLLPKSIETRDGIKPEAPKSANRAEMAEKAEALAMPAAPAIKVNWLDLASTVVFGAILAAVVTMIAKRKLRI